jgi:hypothetical protein
MNQPCTMTEGRGTGGECREGRKRVRTSKGMRKDQRIINVWGTTVFLKIQCFERHERSPFGRETGSAIVPVMVMITPQPRLPCIQYGGLVLPASALGMTTLISSPSNQ